MTCLKDSEKILGLKGQSFLDAPAGFDSSLRSCMTLTMLLYFDKNVKASMPQVALVTIDHFLRTEICVLDVSNLDHIIYASLKPKILVAASGPLSTKSWGQVCSQEGWNVRYYKMRRKPLRSRSTAVIIYLFHNLILTTVVTLASKLLTVPP
jgi:hypothetical protein